MTACANNQRQLSTGMLMYVGDENGFFPTNKGYSSQEHPLHTTDSYLNWESNYWMWQLINNYDASKGSFLCSGNPLTPYTGSDPTWVIGVGRSGTTTYPYTAGYGHTNYSMNGLLINESPDWPCAGYVPVAGRISRVQSPSRMIMLLEYIAPVMCDYNWQYVYRSISGFQTDESYLRDHRNQTCNLAAVDGHVETLRYGVNPNKMTFEGRTGNYTDENGKIHGILWYSGPAW
jgi:prepilin-type processing-associated H-X9-DG protein